MCIRDSRFTADKPTLVATLCTGYADGYPRQLSCGKGIVEIHGKACPVLGLSLIHIWIDGTLGSRCFGACGVAVGIPSLRYWNSNLRL